LVKRRNYARASQRCVPTVYSIACAWPARNNRRACAANKTTSPRGERDRASLLQPKLESVRRIASQLEQARDHAHSGWSNRAPRASRIDPSEERSHVYAGGIRVIEFMTPFNRRDLRRAQNAMPENGCRLHTSRRNGGGGRIRTHENLAALLVFKTSAFNHSATPPTRPAF
jgi:hypothetical protein